MKKIKLFDLIEKSFLALKKTNKKIWIIGIIISIFSGGLTIQESFAPDLYSDLAYEDEFYEDGYYEDEYYNEDVDISESDDTLLEGLLGYAIPIIIIAILIFIAIVLVIGVLISTINYYLYHSICESLFDTKLERASLGLVVKANLTVILKVIGGFILFIIPGIIISLKYAPVNYVLCKNPELSSKEILEKTRELSKGFKWKIFIFNLFISIIMGIIMILCSPGTFVDGYIWVNILDTLVTFAITTFMVVYSGLFDIYLYNGIENIKDKLAIE